MRMTIAFLAVFLLMGCQKQESPHASQAQQAESMKSGPSEVVRRCPNGHTTIKLIPIIYGLIRMTYELREKEKNLEVALGGCEVDSIGKFKIACTTCGAHTYEGKVPWYDETTKVIPSGNAVKGNRNAEPTDALDSK